MESASVSADAPIKSRPDATGGKPASKRPFLIVGLVILTGIIALVGYVMRTRRQESTDDAQVEGDVVMISVRVPGLVVAVPAEDQNHRIKKGELIAQVDDTDYARRDSKQAQAELAQAQAQAAQAEAQEQMVAASAKGGIAAGQALVAGSSFAVRSAHANIASARAAVDLAEGDARSAALDLARNKALLADNAVPQSKLDEAQAAADRARATVAQARAALSASEEQQHAADARVSEAQGRLTQSAPIETQLNAARANTEFQRGRVTGAEAAVAPGAVSSWTPHTSSLRRTGCSPTCRCTPGCSLPWGRPSPQHCSFLRTCTSSRTSRRRRSEACDPDSRSQSRSTPSRHACSKAKWTPSREERRDAFRCCRRTTQRRTS